MGIPNPKYISQEEYLEMERSAIEKHEYYKGEVFAMSGASLPHNLIFKNTYLTLGIKLKGKKCQPFGSDLRVNIPKNTLYTYPDITIICGKPQLTDDNQDTITNPTVIIEILSKSTRDYDRGQKFALYRDITSLKEYILIDSENVAVEKMSRNADSSWTLRDFGSIDDSFTIASIDVTLALSDIYFEVFDDESKG